MRPKTYKKPRRGHNRRSFLKFRGNEKPLLLEPFWFIETTVRCMRRVSKALFVMMLSAAPRFSHRDHGRWIVSISFLPAIVPPWAGCEYRARPVVFFEMMSLSPDNKPSGTILRKKFRYPSKVFLRESYSWQIPGWERLQFER